VKTLLAALAVLFVAPSPPPHGRELLRQMHDRYAGRWYRTLTFVQQNTATRPDGSTEHSVWKEFAAIPGRLRIDFQPGDSGNGALFANDSQFTFAHDSLASATAFVHPLMVLGFDVYAQPVERTIAQLEGLKIDLSIVHEDAWHGRPVVTEADVRDAVRLALPHRRRRDPLDPPGADQQALDDALQAGSPPPEPDDDGPGSGGAPPPRDDGDGDGPPGPAPQQAPAPVGTPFRARTLTVRGTGAGGPVGRRSAAYARRGRVVGARLPGAGALSTVHIPATLRAAAVRRPFQVGPADLRQAVHIGREANLVLFVVDASGSMAARQRMSTVKTAVLSLLRDAYQRRDRVGLVTFRGSEANLVLPPTSSHEVGVLRLRDLATGGRTPLAAGLRTAARTLDAERRRDPSRRVLLVVVTDGRATSGPDPLPVARALSGTAAVVVDCESGPVRLGLAGRLAAALDADCLRLEELSASVLRRAA